MVLAVGLELNFRKSPYPPLAQEKQNAKKLRSLSRRTSAAPPAVRGLETSLDYAHVEKKTKEAQTFIRQNMHVCTKSIYFIRYHRVVTSVLTWVMACVRPSHSDSLHTVVRDLRVSHQLTRQSQGPAHLRS